MRNLTVPLRIRNIVIAPSEETSEETRAQEPRSLLTPFIRDEKISRDEDDVRLSEVGKKSKKTLVKSAKLVISTSKGVAHPAKKIFAMSKRKVVDTKSLRSQRVQRNQR